MRGLFEGVEESTIAGALCESWGFDVQSLEYAAVGAGSYHWLAEAADGTRGFVTVDDLDGKLWLGDTREAVFEGLERALDTARALHDHGLPFVAAPLPTADGSTLRRLGPRHTVALFPAVDGEASEWGEHGDAGRAAVFELLAELHAATPAVAATAATIGLEIAGRRHVEQALRELDRSWAGGPFSEAAREGLARHAARIVELLGLADRFAADVAGRGAPWVRYFRLTWDLKDLAEYLNLFRSPHRVDEDTAREVEFVRNCGSIRDQWAAFLD